MQESVQESDHLVEPDDNKGNVEYEDERHFPRPDPKRPQTE